MDSDQLQHPEWFSSRAELSALVGPVANTVDLWSGDGRLGSRAAALLVFQPCSPRRGLAVNRATRDDV